MNFVWIDCMLVDTVHNYEGWKPNKEETKIYGQKGTKNIF